MPGAAMHWPSPASAPGAFFRSLRETGRGEDVRPGPGPADAASGSASPSARSESATGRET